MSEAAKLSEQQVLDFAGLNNFTDIPQNKVLSLTSLIPYMDPDVAKKIIEQCPELVRMNLEALKSSKDVMLKSLETNSDNSKQLYDLWNRTIAFLETAMSQPNLTPENQTRCLDMVADLIEKSYTKDTENKAFNLQISKTQAILLSVALGCAVVFLGGKFVLKSPQVGKAATAIGKTLLSAM